ncbi:hypothetical protein GCM10010387_16190 [Streptomyces inusitatus]|uniref:Uncharacterized protein n=1 Tax=Streptomyces inusitatus TaxID=68221 RepID=A0A918PV11_9ACTN|nr:hypothetical protein [Streptomyces inusitatus]GGZ23733.1 hypothetical protein GCM10010387_16190 [Streptomyces inusitatus]
MGRSTNALLVYGYDLGGDGDGDGWKVQETDEYGGLAELDWFDEEHPEADFCDAVERRLLAVLGGFTEEWTEDARNTGYYDREKAAKARVHVKVETHCSDGAPSYLLAVNVTTARRGDPVVIDVDDLTRSRLAADWDDLLAEALQALGLTPLQAAPAWILASYADGF